MSRYYVIKSDKVMDKAYHIDSARFHAKRYSGLVRITKVVEEFKDGKSW